MNISPPSTSFEQDSRAQLMLLAGLVILVSLSVLVLVLNTVLYTSNIESREVLPEADLAKNYADTLETQYTTVIESQNEQNYASQSTAHDETTAALLATNQLLGAQYAESQGVYATINPFRTTNATVIQHTDRSCTFESAEADCSSDGGSNARPVADYSATPNPAAATQSITFDAGASSDSDGSITQYEWDFNNDGTTDATGSSVMHSYGSSGSYDVTLTVTDDAGATDSEIKTVTVETTTGNTAPTADFTYSPSSPDTKETVTFDGSSSSDSDGTISQYEWDFNNDGTTDATGQTTSNSFNPQGDYPVTLTVTDDDGTTDTITKTVTATKGNGGGGGGGPFSITSLPELNSPSSAGSTTDWTLATTSEFRNFEFNIDKSDVSTSVDAGGPFDQSILRSDTFYVRLDGTSGNTKRVYIFRSLNDEMMVATQLNDGPINRQYTGDVENVEIDLTTGTVNSDTTSINLTDGLSGPFTISFRNGDVIQGQYKLVLPNSPSASTSINTGNFNDAPNTDSPYLSNGLYSVRVEITFNVDGISFTTKSTIAPDKPEVFAP